MLSRVLPVVALAAVLVCDGCDRCIVISDGCTIFKHLEHVVVGVGNIPVLSSSKHLNGYKTPRICAMEKNLQ